MLGTLLLARGLPFRRGAIYTGGCFVALIFLLSFGATNIYPLALLALVLAGAGTAGFATMQAVLVMVTASPEMRGRALGLTSMAIGVLPFSMLLLGLTAQTIGLGVAVMGSAVLGLLAMAAWTLLRPEAQRLA
jgi:hypothetical protein